MGNPLFKILVCQFIRSAANFLTGIPEIKPAFYYSIIVASVIDVIAAWCFLNAIASSQLAKTFPLVAFTPIFATGTSFFILGEIPSVLGLVGILLIVCGVYLLRAESIKVGILEPIKLLLKEKGQRYMLMAAFLFSFLAVFFKKAILNSSPFFAFGVTQLLSTLFLTVLFLKKKTLGVLLKKTADNFKLLFIASIIGFLAGLTLFAAFVHEIERVIGEEVVFAIDDPRVLVGLFID